MPAFLLFTIYAPFSSWGDIAVGENRGSWDRPSRSATLGLLGAALGIDRSDQCAHDALDGGYGVAVRADQVGTPLVDYHTAQTFDNVTVKRTTRDARRAMLAKGSDLAHTILSRRSYRQDAIATIAMWARDNARWSLSEIEDALKHPSFVLYAGRRANPLALPVNPGTCVADSLADAFARRSAKLQIPERFMPWPSRTAKADRRVEISHDPCVGFESGLTLVRTETRRDARAHRTRWQFAERLVNVSIADRTGEL